ncbi:hypothetical protein ERUR111494_02475 [Erysipelothrix urinaevulpis]
MFNNKNKNEVIASLETEYDVEVNVFKANELFVRIDGQAINLKEALDQQLVVPDLYGNYFREAKNEQERNRGYYEN